METARPSQITPDGDWATWLILAGRGWGKTRTGAEDVAWYAQKHPGSRIAVVAPTYADARDTCVEGQSGLLGIIPKECVAAWNRSLGELILVNGSRFKLFSADEPERLRGPQHHRAWCFIAGTMVTTPDGDRLIESLIPGDLVLTRDGPRRVTKTQSHFDDVGLIKFSNNTELVGTADHLIYLLHGWTRMDRLCAGDIACAIDVSNGAASAGIAMATAAVPITSELTRRSDLKRPGGSTLRFGARLLAIFPKALRSITRTTIRRTIASKIWSALKRHVTAKFIAPLSLSRAAIGLRGLFFPSDVLAAANLCSGAPRRWRFVDHASSNGPNGLVKSFGNVLNAVRHLKPAAAISAVSVVSTWRPLERQKVFCLSVEGTPEYFANGILVHNCDELAAWNYAETFDQLLFGLRLGADPRAVVTTTPKPTGLIKSLVLNKTTLSTRGSTFDNAANLAPAALQQLRAKYEGTRLGRQELNAEILEEVEGALWTRAMIEACRRQGGRLITAPPTLRRIVVAVDPAITDKAESNLTGIIAAGVGQDGRGYVLGDASGRFSPDGWATKAVSLFDSLAADRIVAEGNQGGDMVRHTIRSIRKTLPISIVHASRGKFARAEPIAALYEQGRISHCSEFKDLEDQLCTWEPLGQTPSPDRLDALVWALTDLFMNQPPVAVVGRYGTA